MIENLQMILYAAQNREFVWWEYFACMNNLNDLPRISEATRQLSCIYDATGGVM